MSSRASDPPQRPIESWQAALDRIYGLANWETRPPGTLPSFELDRIRALLSALGEPQRRFPSVHVAGTNGKGSTSAMIHAGLRAAGLRAGLFTSPHLHSLRERIRVDETPISEAQVIAWLNRNRDLLDALPGLTTFECLTAMGFDHFADAMVDVAVVEVGLGGRLDTTNVLEPALSVFTSIGMDHAAVLGDTIEAIARDKAGIIKRGVPVVSAAQAPEAMGAIEARARELGAPLYRCDQIVRASRPSLSEQGEMVLEVAILEDASPESSRSAAARFAPSVVPEQEEQAKAGSGLSWKSSAAAPGTGLRLSLSLSLFGSFQVENAACACLALWVLSESGWPLEPATIEAGLAAARWPARFECLALETSGATLVVDGAHNPPAAEALAASLDWRFGAARRHWILGFSRDKDLAAILAALRIGLGDGAAAGTLLTVAADHPRALSAAEASERLRAFGLDAEPAAGPDEALRIAVERAGPGELVVATGSIFLAAELRMAWFRRAGLPLPEADPPPP